MAEKKNAGTRECGQLARLHDSLRRRADEMRRAVADSVWGKFVGKAVAYGVGFVLLALVGSGRVLSWVSPPTPVPAIIPQAEAAVPSALPSAKAATSMAQAPEPTDAGTAPEDGGSDDGGTSSGIAPDGKVILNLATEEDLRHLPGIGAKRAKAILELRSRIKRFSRVEDLLKVKGLGRKKLATLRPLLRVD